MAISATRRVAGATAGGVPGVRNLVRAGLGRVFGPPPFDPHADPGDPGLFGTGAASWGIVAEPAAIVGGVRALLVQLLHPLAMAGVADHSAFRDDPLGRLHRTSAYVTATAFGSTREALAVARMVRGAHRAVRGTAPDGRDYAASDPHLLAWVSISLTSSFLATDRVYAPRPAEPAAADQFVAEQSRAAALLDPRVDLAAIERDPDALAALRAGDLALPLLDDGTLPRSASELRRQLAEFRGELEVNEQGRDAFRFLRWPPLAAPIRAGYLPMLAGALASLEPHQRRLLGLPGSRTAAWAVQANTRALLAAFRLSTGLSPSLAAAGARAAADPGTDPMTAAWP
ncbi:MAG: DUF2236 domain-containing protein [Euzebyales bacterium]|nr:DUF2236 domain-containing protein [Euzebyales bacterium]